MEKADFFFFRIRIIAGHCNIAGKRIMEKLYVTIIVAASALLYGCADAIAPSATGEGPLLRLELVDGNPHTKGETINGTLVEDLNIYLFNSEGVPVFQKYFPDGNFLPQTLEYSKGDKFSVYALANWGVEHAVSSEQEIAALEYAAQNVASLMDERCADVLCGKMDNVAFPLPDGKLAVPVRRIVGKITLVCDLSGIDEGVSLQVQKVTLKNAPVGTLLFADNVAQEVATAAVLEGDALSTLEGEGVDFYLFENMQGYIGDLQENKSKANMLSDGQKMVCSYVELECRVVTDTRRGTVVYRFYLGTDHSDCNVPRGTVQTVTVKFKGAVSHTENSVSVDNSGLGYRAASISLSPSALEYYQKKQFTCQYTITVYPANADDKRVIWGSTNEAVATVDQNGLMTSRGKGRCYIYARSVDRPEVEGTASVYIRYDPS